MIKYWGLILITFFSINTRGDVISTSISEISKQNCHAKKNYQFISKKKKNEIEKQFNFSGVSQTVRRFSVKCGDDKTMAFVFNDKIRTHYQSLLVWIAQGTVKGIKTLEFNEPVQYEAPKSWLKNIVNKNKTQLYKVDALSGATLTRQSTLKIVKQALYFSSNE